MVGKRHYYILGAFLVGTFIALTLTRPDLTVLSKSLVNLKSAIQSSAKAEDRETEEEPVFGDFTGTAQDNPMLIQFLKNYVVQQPSTGPYKLENPSTKDFSEFKQSTLADTLIFKGKKNGFFVEAGAVDGEFHSNTLYFEREHGWKGLLIEPNHDTFSKIMEKGRKAYAINGAISPVKSPMDLLFFHLGPKGIHSRASSYAAGMHVDAYPLYPMLMSVSAAEVDFFSLDIQGGEMKVLNAIPWEKVKFRVLCIDQTNQPLGEMIKLLSEKGYKHIGVHKEDAWFVDNETFSKNKDLKIQ